jgi:hypothetical protein
MPNAITHRAIWEASALLHAQLTESPVGCPCRDCRTCREQGWENGEGDCLLSAEWEVSYDPHTGMTAQRWKESGKRCEDGQRIKLDSAGCVARWGAQFVAAIEAILEHEHWYNADAPKDDYNGWHSEPPLGTSVENSQEIAAADAARPRRMGDVPSPDVYRRLFGG